MPEIPITLVVKLASIVAHVLEADPSKASFEFDHVAAKSLAHDPEVTTWLASIDPVLLPSKRAE